MEVKFYNSLSNKVETFVPQEEGKVSMYVCGPTVYSYPHIGNMRPVVVFDTLRRFLTYIGYDVTYVSNVTDVDDKIIAAAKANNTTEKEIAKYYEDVYFKNTKDIGSLTPTIVPRVTEYIQSIINYIDNLVKKDAAQVIDGDVYFRISKIKDYGCLSGIKIDDLIAGARVEENSKKESPLDFALWKKTDEGIKWDSPWGQGRPGWHTECCVMIDTIFPRHFIDIHGGGYDLKFPHHENEIAQSEATHNNKIAKYWIHNGFIDLDGEKMSKSLGNVVLAKDVIEKVGGEVARLAILSTHYRMPVNLTDETIKAATQEINKIKMAYKQAALTLQTNDVDLTKGKAKMDKFLESLADDLNTSNALSELYNVIKDMNLLLRSRPLNLEALNDNFKTVTDMLYVLGLNINYIKLSDEDRKIIDEYNESKANKDFARSDELRKILIDK